MVVGVLALLLGAAWQVAARARWHDKTSRALIAGAGASLALLALFAVLDAGRLGWISVGLALGAGAGWPLGAFAGRRIKPPHVLWGLAILVVIGLALLPFDPDSTLARLHGSDWALPDRIYRLVKPAILWAGLGTVAGLAGAPARARVWIGATVAGFLLVAPFAARSLTWADTVEVLALLPGLAAGTWLGGRSRLAEVHNEPAAAAEASSATGTGEGDLRPAERIGPGEYTEPSGGAGHAANSAGRISAGGLIAGLALATVVVWSLLDFPLGRLALELGLAAYGAALWRWPGLVLVVVSAALPLLDLAPWSGRFFWDEFDVLMLASLAIALARGRLRASVWRVPKFAALLLLFLLAWLTSLALGLFPFQPLDANAFSAYWSHYNSLRLAKGLVWGLVVYGLFRSQADQGKAFKELSIGMALGVLGVSLWAIWEEALFAGSATTADYRVTASFSSMHTGGGHIEAYLVMALPFVWGLFFRVSNPLYRAVLGADFLLGAYALFFTVARGGAIALVVALMVLICGTWLARRKQSRHRARSLPLVMGLLTLMVMMAGVSGVFWRERLQQTGTDAGIRLHHWAEVLDMRNAGLMTTLFGQGLGSFPAVNLANQLPDQAGSYRYVSEPDGNTYLALNSAGTLYMAQRVPPRPAQTLKLELSVRAPSAKAGLEASLCEKSLFNSRRCQWLKVDFKHAVQEWQRFTQAFNGGDVGAGNFLTRRPVQFSLYNPIPGTVVDVDNVRLMDASGQNLLRNGDFSHGGDFWFFKSGNHLVWHAKNLWVHLLFEQGWLGMSLFTLILILALVRLARAVSRGELEATVLLASIGAWIVVGGVDSLVDAPRIALLVYGSLFIAAAWGSVQHAHVKHRRHRHHPLPHGEGDHAASPA